MVNAANHVVKKTEKNALGEAKENMHQIEKEREEKLENNNSN